MLSVLPPPSDTRPGGPGQAVRIYGPGQTRNLGTRRVPLRTLLFAKQPDPEGEPALRAGNGRPDNEIGIQR